MIVEMNVADVRAGVELDSACLPGTVLPWLLDRQLVFCWISRCPGELGIAVTALMARVQSALWHGGFASIISPYVYFPAQGFHGDVLDIGMRGAAQGHFAVWAGTELCLSQLGTSQTFMELWGKTAPQSSEPHPAGPRLVSETATQRHLKITSKYLHSFPLFKFCYLSFMLEVSWPLRMFTEVGYADLTHATSCKARKILTCNKLFISTKSVSRLQHSQTDLEGYTIDLKMHGWFSLSCDNKDG